MLHGIDNAIHKVADFTKEFVQNIDWKKVAIGVGVTAVVAIAVAVTGGAAAAAIPVLIGAGMGAGVGTGISVVTGIAQGKTAAEIAGDASDAFMWGAIGGAISGGTGSLLQSAGKSAASSFVRNNLIESGIDTVVDLTQTGITNGKITTKDVLLKRCSFKCWNKCSVFFYRFRRIFKKHKERNSRQCV